MGQNDAVARGRTIAKRILGPVRRAAGRFVITSFEQRLTPSVEIERALVYKAARFVAAERIEGDYLEFGVFRGTSFARAFHCFREAFDRATAESVWNTDADRDARREQWERMRFFAFDSFQGLPAPRGPDSSSNDFVAGKFASSESDFRRSITSQGVPSDRVVTVPGWFAETVGPDTFRRHDLRRAAVVNIDCDLYESAKTVLDGITPLLADGSVLLFDDWFSFRGHPAFGEQRACREWLDAHPELALTEYNKEGPWRNSFIVHVRPSPGR
jgi:O-methyltransferase